jgi:hypothetical protein
MIAMQKYTIYVEIVPIIVNIRRRTLPIYICYEEKFCEIELPLDIFNVDFVNFDHYTVKVSEYMNTS